MRLLHAVVHLAAVLGCRVALEAVAVVLRLDDGSGDVPAIFSLQGEIGAGRSIAGSMTGGKLETMPPRPLT